MVGDGEVEYDEASDALDGESGSEDGEQVYHVPDHPGAYTVDAGPAEFSDLEAQSDGSEGGRHEDVESEEEERPARKRARRAVISDESDEGESDEGDEGPVRKRARRAVVSDESDEGESDEGESDEGGNIGKGKDESEDKDEDDEGDIRKAPVRRRARRAVVSEDEDDE